MTTSFDVKDSKTVRKLQVDEVIEVLESRKTEGAIGLSRVRCRALFDHKEGWATLTGNQGTAFMDKCAKPYYCCEEEDTAGQSSFDSSSDEACKIQPGEVLELLEGPRQEEPQESQRMKGKSSDGKVGWVTLKDAQGNVNLEKAPLLVCNQIIAITTTYDIVEGKAIRKLDVGETLEVLEGPKEDSVRGLTRVKARAKSDDKEGWVTIKGSKGTSYVEESSKHYIVKRGIPLEKRFLTGTDELRKLEEGDTFELIEGPKTETKEGPKRIRGKAVSDGKEGWFTLSSKAFQQWAPKYKVANSTVIDNAVSPKDAKAVRKLETGEILDALETPVFEKAAGLLRVRVRAVNDGATGFATLRGNQGTVMLQPLLGGSA